MMKERDTNNNVLHNVADVRELATIPAAGDGTSLFGSIDNSNFQ